MARGEVSNGDTRRKRRKRKYYDAPQHEEDEIAQSESDTDAYEPPMDTAALREARLKAMDTPAIARQKMKHEYLYTRPAKTAGTVRARKVKTSPSTIRPRTSVVAVKPKTTAVKQPKSTDDTYQFVYRGTTPSLVDRRDFQNEHDAQWQVPKANQEKRKSTATKAEKPKVERRKTEPITRRPSIAATMRPQVKKSTTTTKVKKVEDPEKEKPETVISNAKSNKSQRNSSVFGGLFAKPPPVSETMVSCLTCGSDSIPKTQSAKLPCSHRMCHSCLKRIFRLSVKDPAHMPPKCCDDNEIDLKHVDSLFDSDFKKTWNRKLKEYKAKNRIYCPRKGCGEWIQPKHMRFDDNRRKIGICPKCNFKTCATCNQKAHKSRECPKDPAMKQFAEAAEQAGWRKCYNCSAMVELKEGCNHMTCRCTAEFCMVCGLKWKGCDCPWFSYNAVNDAGADPVQNQREMDRRQRQMQEDERVARRMAGLNLREFQDRRGDVGQFEVNNFDEQMNANFLQQARQALTANYQNAEVAARGLLGGWLAGRDNNPPATVRRARTPAALPEDLDQDLHQPPGAFPVTPPRRRTHRVHRVRRGVVVDRGI